MMAFFLVPLTNECISYSGFQMFERLEVYDECVTLSRCVFGPISTTGMNYGGAISFKKWNDELTVSDCTFFSCVLYYDGLDDYGGAIYTTHARLSFDRCCASQCRAQYGQAIYFEGTRQGEADSLPELSATVSALTDCSDPDDLDSETGAISTGLECNVNAIICNLSRCGVSPAGHIQGIGYGAAFYTAGSQVSGRSFRFTDCLIEKCQGDTIIDGEYTGTITMTSCAFISNAGANSLFRVVGPAAKISIGTSYFKANGASPLFAQTSSAVLYGLSHCFFDIGALPDIPYFETSGNFFNWAEAIELTCYLNTALCQADPPCPTSKFTGSSPLTHSAGLRGTVMEEGTRVFGGTAVFPDSVHFGRSAVGDSSPVDASGHFDRSALGDSSPVDASGHLGPSALGDSSPADGSAPIGDSSPVDASGHFGRSALGDSSPAEGSAPLSESAPIGESKAVDASAGLPESPHPAEVSGPTEAFTLPVRVYRIRRRIRFMYLFAAVMPDWGSGIMAGL
jgi:hypothetical protein